MITRLRLSADAETWVERCERAYDIAHAFGEDIRPVELVSDGLYRVVAWHGDTAVSLEFTQDGITD